MKKGKSLLSMGFSFGCMVALTAAFALPSTGCIVVCKGARCCKFMGGCKTKCIGKCKTPCKNPDGTAKCGPDCKKPCCAKKAKDVTDSAVPGGAKTAMTTADAKNPGCSKKCKKPCGAKGSKIARCGPDCKKPCCAKDTKTSADAKAATGT